jgi:predicted KAP-like P-loop ATPase
MWPDNETTVDLLGFDYLVDSLEVILTQPGMLPLTVGVLGDWGSGKTSLLQMAQERLDAAEGYVTVFFSPWRYEAYEDVKAALMDTILKRLEEEIPEAETEKKKKLIRLRGMAARMRAGSAAAAKSLVAAAMTYGAAHAGLPPELAAPAGAVLVAGATAAEQKPQVPEDDTAQTVEDSVTKFRQEFKQLLDSLDAVKAVVVFIDDLDRCLDETVIYVFEAIRLFLQVSSTAFVLAANRDIVQAAIDRRYPATREDGPALGKDYLEKIIQVEITVPPLSEAEAETYLNLLFAQLRLDLDQMSTIRQTVALRRQQGQFAVAMNYGIAKDALGAVGDELTADFAIANRIAPILSRGLRGNPRQLKRFLNTMLLRLQTAKRRTIELDPQVLAKLMVLEQTAPKEFQQLFLWQVAQDGTPEELATAEVAVAEGKTPDGADVFTTWFGQPAVQSWLKLEPVLGDVALGEYFFFSRDRLAPAAPGARLSAALQALLGKLQSSVAAQRRTAITAVVELPVEERAPLYEALLDRAVRRPESDAMKSLVELTAKLPATWPTLTAALGAVPPNDIPPALPVQLLTVGRDQPGVGALIDQWAASDNTGLKKAIRAARGTRV